MKIIVSRNHLFARLRTIGRLVKSGKEVMYNSFLFDCMDGKLTVTGCDEAGQISTPVECQVHDNKDVRFLVDSSTLLNSLKELPEQPLTFDVNTETLAIKIYYHNGKFELTGADAKLFPELKPQDKERTISIHGDTLRSGFKMMKFAATDDTLRPIMCTINVSSKNGILAFAASTGHNLGVYEEDTKEDAFDVNIPVKIAKIVTDMTANENKDITMTFDDRSIRFQIDDYLISYRLFEGRFPNYRGVIPQDAKVIVTADREDLIAAINRVSVFADDSSMMLKFELSNNNIILTSESIGDQRKAKEDIFLDSVHEDFIIGFKGNLLAEILKTIDTEKCEIHLKSPDTAAVFKPVNGEKLTLLLMPMQINN